MEPNPIYDLLVEALDCADRLPFAGEASPLLVDAIHRTGQVVERPNWLPQFEALVKAMHPSQPLQGTS